MKKVLMIFILFCVLTCIPVCNAEECDVNHLKEVANTVKVQSEFNYDASKVGIFTENIVTVYGITNEIYAITDDESVGFYVEDMVNGSAKKIIQFDDSERLKIYSTKCSNMLLRSIDLDLKRYNPYHNYSECEGLEKELDVCKEFYNENISYEEFVKKVDAYKNKFLKNDIVENDKKSVLDFLKDNIIIVIIGGIAIIAIVVAVILNNIKKNRLD